VQIHVNDQQEASGVLKTILASCFAAEDNSEIAMERLPLDRVATDGAIERAFQKFLDEDLDVGFPDLSYLEGRQQEMLKELFFDFPEIFQLMQMGACSTFEYGLKKIPHEPFCKRAYRISAHAKNLLSQEVAIMLQNKVIRPSSSPYSSPVFIIPKKDGTGRFVLDARFINSVIESDRFPLPHVRDMLDHVKGHIFFSHLDLKSGYWQVRLREEDVPLTAFQTDQGLFEFLVMPFGVKTAPAAFQRLVQSVLAPVYEKGCIIYIDDLLLYSRTLDEHFALLRQVFTLLCHANLRLNPSKCTFLLQRVSFLGHILSASGVEVDPEKIAAMVNYPQPNTKKQLRSFLGLCNYYHPFIHGFSVTAAPLYGLLAKSNPTWNWGAAHETAFQALKEVLTRAPILQQPDYLRPFIIVSDASRLGVGAMLGQSRTFVSEDLDSARPSLPSDILPIAFCSHKLSDTELNYSVTEIEAYGILFALNKFRTYVDGMQIAIFTDHAALRDIILKTTVPTLRLQKFVSLIAQYDPRIFYISGGINVIADALSRVEGDVTGVPESRLLSFHPVEDALATVQPTLDDHPSVDTIPEGQLRDPETSTIKNSLRPGLVNPIPGYAIIDEVLYFRSYINGASVLRLFVPSKFRRTILDSYHTDLQSGHVGVSKTYNNIKRRYFWPRLYKDCLAFIASCPICQQEGSVRQSDQAPVIPLPVVEPFDRFGIDVLGPLPLTKLGNKYLVVLVDHGTRWPEAFPVPHTKASLIADLLYQHIICRYGAPRELLSDRGSNFLSKIVRHLCRVFDISKVSTTSYHPQCNGLVERMNGTLTHILRKTICRKQATWDVFVPAALYAYRVSTHPTLKVSPYELMFGRTPRLPIDVLLGKETLRISSPVISFEAFKDHVTETRRLAISLYEDEQSRIATPTYTPTFQVGDEVWLYTPVVKVGEVKKLKTLWTGPYMITEVTSPVNYRIHNDKTGKSHHVHVARLKRVIRRKEKPDDYPTDLRLDEAVEAQDPDNLDPSDPPRDTVLDGIRSTVLEEDNSDSDEDSEDDTEYHGSPLYQVEKILDCKVRVCGSRTYRKYLVSWKGFDESHNSWEPATSFKYNIKTLEDFHKDHPLETFLSK